jgi:hypothetical protein
VSACVREHDCGGKSIRSRAHDEYLIGGAADAAHYFPANAIVVIKAFSACRESKRVC